MTTAERIAEQFGNDGLNWHDDEGQCLDAACEAAGGIIQWRDGYRMGYTYRFGFEDGSAIVVVGDAWDIEGEESFSWAGS